MNRADDIRRLFDERMADAEVACGTDVPCTFDLGHYTHFKTPRGYGVTFYQEGKMPHVRLSWKCLYTPMTRVDGVIRHEIGHVLDMVFSPKAVDRWAESRGKRLPPVKDIERRADAIALCIWGEPIYYDGDDVQSTCCGVYPRPERLGR